ncbi:MAG TPA: hypothetical protein VLT86_12710 [Vicinamibacterales bacterium]|nr:hypothetical protein [Vicinamibacterales bacterium]
MLLVAPLVLAAALAQQAPAPAAAPDYTFPSGAGLLFFYVKPDKTADFEAIVARLSDVLDKTEDPVRKQQAANWRILRSVETTKDNAIYVMLFVPAVGGADYDPIKVLSEALPTEVQGLYERLRDAVVRVERMGLAKIR